VPTKGLRYTDHLLAIQVKTYRKMYSRMLRGSEVSKDSFTAADDAGRKKFLRYLGKKFYRSY